MKIRQYSKLCKHSKLSRRKLLKCSIKSASKFFTTKFMKWESLRGNASFI